MQDTNVLVWLPSPMGDVILCTPALRAIREYFKSCRITFYANSVARQILSPCSFNDNWLEQNDNNPFTIAKVLKRHKFTHAILFKNSFASAMAVFLAGIPTRIGYAREKRSFMLTDKLYPEKLRNGKFKPVSMVDYYLAIASSIGADTTNRNLELSIEPSEKENLRLKLPELFQTDGPIIILVPGGAFGPSKFWPGERFAQTADKLIGDYNATVVISVASNLTEKRIAEKICRASRFSKKTKQGNSKSKLINLAEKPVNLGELKALFSMSDLVISNDTGPRHIAIALGRKVVSLFGPNNPVWTDTNYEKEIEIIGNVHCAPCHNPICKKSEHYCMQAITVDTAYKAAKELIENNRKHARIYTQQKFDEITESFYIDSDYKQALDTLGLNSIDSVFSFKSARNLTKKNLAFYRSRLQLEVNPPNSVKPVTLFLKRYDRPPISIQLKNWFSSRSRKSCGSLEFETADALTLAGINTPKTIAYGTQWGTIFEERSFIITEKIPNAEALERKLPEYFKGKKTKENLKLQRQFISKSASFIKKFHKTNYRHRDLYLSHVFYNENEIFYLIDLARAFRPLILSQRYQIKDIAQIYYSAPGKYFSRTDRVRFFLNYTGHSKLTNADKTFIRKVIDKAKRMAQHDNKHGRQTPFTDYY